LSVILDCVCIFLSTLLSSSIYYLYCHFCLLFFFFNDPATTEIYTLSLHDALPISSCVAAAATPRRDGASPVAAGPVRRTISTRRDRKSTRLNSSHRTISYAVFCLKKKKKKKKVNK